MRSSLPEQRIRETDVTYGRTLPGPRGAVARFEIQRKDSSAMSFS
jgi:hypothetical protein